MARSKSKAGPKRSHKEIYSDKASSLEDGYANIF
jgi:hypothetical protein